MKKIVLVAVSSFVLFGCEEKAELIRREAIREIAENAGHDERERMERAAVKVRVLSEISRGRELIERMRTEIGIGTTEMELAMMRLESTISVLKADKILHDEVFEDSQVMDAMDDLERDLGRLGSFSRSEENGRAK